MFFFFVFVFRGISHRSDWLHTVTMHTHVVMYFCFKMFFIREDIKL